MPRRKAAEVEILPHENNQPSQKIKEVKHKTEWVEVIEESPQDSEIDLVDDEAVEERPRKRVNNEREELRKKLAKNRVTPGSELKLTIEKYPHSEVIDGHGGVHADTEHCAKYVCEESHILNEDYLDVARSKFGAGLYRFTLRMKNQIVTAWDKRITTGAQGPVIQHINPNDPTSPQVIIQSNGDGQQQPMSMRDIMKGQKEALKEHLEMTKLMREAYGLAPDAPSTTAETDPETLLLKNLANNDKFMEKVNSGLLSKLFGKDAVADEPGWSTVVMEAVKNHEVAASIQAFGNIALMFLDRLLPQRGNDNGQTTMAPSPVPAMANQNTQPPAPAPALPAHAEGQRHGAIQEGVGTDQGGEARGDASVQDPYAQMLTGVLTTLASNGPVEDAVNRVEGFLLLYPAYTETIDNQFSQPAENLLGAISTIPGCDQIAKADHAKQWIELFQAKFFAEGESEEE